MTQSNLIIGNPVPEDAEEIAGVDRHSWPAGLAGSAAQFRARIEAYPEGQLAADLGGRIVGSASAQRITQEFLEANQGSLELITDGGRFTKSHAPEGEIYQLVGVGVLPEMRGLLLGRKLIDYQIEYARSLPEIRRIVGFTRPARYYRYRDLPIEEYVYKTREDGRLVDPVLAFHVEAGAQIVSIHPAFRPEDEQAGGHAVLIEYVV